jgi:hypothetical protein
MALGLTLHQLSAVPEVSLRDRPAIVQILATERSRGADFDPREELVPGMIITLPLGHSGGESIGRPDQTEPPRASKFELN